MNLTCIIKAQEGDALGETWKDLYRWVKESKKYKFGKHQCLEYNKDPTITDPSKFPFDVYFPITE